MKTCTLCNTEFENSNFYKRTASKDGLMTKCKFCSDSWAKNNPEKARGYVDNYHASNRDKILAQKAEYRAANKEKLSIERKAYYALNKEKEINLALAYAKANPDKCCATNAKRRSHKLQAIPSWANLKSIKLIYTECKKTTIALGILHNVDHIVPLVNDIVCGLHCEANLQILTATDNSSKGNRYWPDQP